MAKRDYYEALGVPRTASADEIKKAHRKLVRQHHPDVNKNNSASTAKFQEAQEAYDVLSDTEKRKAYDEFGHAGAAANGPPPGYGQEEAYEAFRRNQGGRGGVQREDFDFGNAPGGQENFGGIFEQLFGGGRQRAGAPQAAAKGNDIDTPLTVDFRDAARGTSVTLNLRTPRGEQSIDVKIPAGVKDGSRVRIKGKGEPGRGGNGDLYIVTSVRPHAYFKRDDLDITLELPISLYEALLGATIDNVPTLDGPVSLKIPPGTSSGAKLRLAERGFHRGKDKGDQLVIMRVIVPKGLDETSRATIEAMAKQYPLEPRKDIRW